MTLPRSDISPVIPVSLLVGILVSADTNAVVIDVPALGPSFGTAPSGTCMCTSSFDEKSAFVEKRSQLRLFGVY